MLVPTHGTLLNDGLCILKVPLIPASLLHPTQKCLPRSPQCSVWRRTWSFRLSKNAMLDSATRFCAVLHAKHEGTRKDAYGSFHLLSQSGVEPVTGTEEPKCKFKEQAQREERERERQRERHRKKERKNERERERERDRKKERKRERDAVPVWAEVCCIVTRCCAALGLGLRGLNCHHVESVLGCHQTVNGLPYPSFGVRHS